MDATLTKVRSRYRLGLERRLAHPPQQVWRVLTERNLLRQWFPCDVEGEWSVGSELRFTFLHREGEGLSDEELRGEVLTVDPPRLLEFRWGTSQIRCELIPEGNGCRLLFSETLDASWGARSAAGWEMCLDNLDLLLDGAAIAKFAIDVWRGKFSHYVKKFERKFGPQLEPPIYHSGVEAEESAQA